MSPNHSSGIEGELRLSAERSRREFLSAVASDGVDAVAAVQRFQTDLGHARHRLQELREQHRHDRDRDQSALREAAERERAFAAQRLAELDPLIADLRSRGHLDRTLLGQRKEQLQMRATLLGAQHLGHLEYQAAVEAVRSAPGGFSREFREAVGMVAGTHATLVEGHRQVLTAIQAAVEACNGEITQQSALTQRLEELQRQRNEAQSEHQQRISARQGAYAEAEARRFKAEEAARSTIADLESRLVSARETHRMRIAVRGTGAAQQLAAEFEGRVQAWRVERIAPPTPHAAPVGRDIAEIAAAILREFHDQLPGWITEAQAHFLTGLHGASSSTDATSDDGQPSATPSRDA